MTAIAFLLTFSAAMPGSTAFITVPGIANLEECQYLAKQLLSNDDPKFKCTAYKIAVGPLKE